MPGILGDGGTSEALEEDALGGFQTSVGLRLGFGGAGRLASPRKAAAPPADPVVAVPVVPMKPVREGLPEGVISQPAPAFILPDATRTPLRTLTAGTSVRVLEEKGEWVRIEWNDDQFGRRVGYVQSKFVTIRRTP
jgi:hypothetical protein